MPKDPEGTAKKGLRLKNYDRQDCCTQRLRIGGRVEILSPGEEIDRKLTLSFAEGALEVWVIDARRKAMTVYSQLNDQVIRRVVDRDYSSEPVQATFSLAEIFE